MLTVFGLSPAQKRPTFFGIRRKRTHTDVWLYATPVAASRRRPASL